jgi:uncharacterized membrane protein HdeD (DUF308 family)
VLKSGLAGRNIFANDRISESRAKEEKTNSYRRFAMGDGIVADVKGIARASIGWSIGLSVLLIFTGLIAICAPMVAGVAVTAVLAWMIVLGGLLHLWMAFHVSGTGAHLWEALVGIAYLATGGYILLHPVAGLVGLTVVLAVYLLLIGLFELALAMKIRPLPGSGLMFLDAILSLALAAMIWWHLPSSAPWAVGTLVGIAILFSGVSRLMLSMAAKKVVA